MLIEELRYVIGVCLLSKMLAITSSSFQNKNTQKHLTDTWHGMASLTIFSSLEQNFSCSVHGISKQFFTGKSTLTIQSRAGYCAGCVQMMKDPSHYAMI